MRNRNMGMLLISMLLICAYSCDKDNSETHLRSIKLTKPESRQSSVTKNYPAIIKESNETGLAFKTAGQISHIYVKEGDYVKQGQLLATLDDSDYQLGVNAVQVQYDQLKTEVDRIGKLYENKGVPGNDYEKAKAGLKQLETQLQVNKNKLSYTRLYSPVSGVVKDVNFSKAEMVDAGTQVFSILDNSGMKVEFDIPVSESATINSGASYQLIYNGKEVSIPLRFISKSPKADGNQLFTVKLGLEGKIPSDITPGINATVAITSIEYNGEDKKGYNLPLRSIINKNGEAKVWVMNPDSTVSMRTVNFSGIDENGMAIITSGINPDDRIVAAGVNSLYEGEKVIVIEDATDTNVGGMM